MTTAQQPAAATEPLAGTLVIDLSRALAGPHATRMPGDLGVRVIKGEGPEGGDVSRACGPPFVPGADGGVHPTCVLSCTRNEESIALDRLGFDVATLQERHRTGRGRVVRTSLPGSPLRFDDRAHSGGRASNAAPPRLDEHGAAIRLTGGAAGVAAGAAAGELR